MAGDVFDFSWLVSENGYRLIDAVPLAEEGLGEARKIALITDGVPYVRSYSALRYFPLRDHSGLFRVFAEVEPTPEGFLTFANSYGLLGESKMIRLPDVRNSEGKNLMGKGEPLDLWFRELYLMRSMVELFDMVQERDFEGLSKRIYWRGKDVFYYDHPDGPDAVPKNRNDVKLGWSRSLIANEHVNSYLLDRFQVGDLVLPALYYIQKVVNKQLEGRVSPRLLWTENSSRLALYIVPESLIGALWLQFAKAIDGDKEYRRCEECRTWFEVSQEGSRTSRVFCSNACRTKAYRKRIAEAKRLHKEGMDVESIAKELGSDPATVKGWLTR